MSTRPPHAPGMSIVSGAGTTALHCERRASVVAAAPAVVGKLG